MQISIGSVHILSVSLSVSGSINESLKLRVTGTTKIFATLGTQTLSVNKPEILRNVVVEQLNILECQD